MAGLIPDNFIQDLLSRTDLVEVVRSRISLKKSGKNYTACCPFHQEKTPSFSVAPDKQFYYCFGCGCKGNAIGFVMEYDHLSFPEAVEKLAHNAGMEVPREKASPQAKAQRSLNQQLYDVLDRASHFFKQQLQTAPERQKAQNYLAQRGLNANINEQFGIGYAPPGFDNLTTGLNLNADQQQLALTAGLLVQNDAGRLYDKFRDRLIFPIRDSRGRVIGFGGRILGDGKPKYLNSPETPVFHKGQELYGLYEWRQSREASRHLLVVEGYMDVISLAQFGIVNSVATLGTATSEDHMRKLFREVDEVVFCFDGDKAGRSAAWRAMESSLGVLEDGKQIRFLFLPEGDDPDSLVRREGPEAIRLATSKAAPLEAFLFDHLAVDLNLNEVSGKARLAHLALPYVRRVKGNFLRELLEEELASRTGLNANELDRLAPEPPPKPAFAPAAQTAPYFASTPTYHTTVDSFQPPGEKPMPGNRLHLTERLLLLLLHHPQLVTDYPPPEGALNQSFAGISMLREAIQLLQAHPVTTPAQALGLFMTLSQGERFEQLINNRLGASTKTLAEREWQGGLLQLQLTQIELQINEERNKPEADIALLQSLLIKRATLQKTRQSLGHLEE